jgi:hypothetical protein
MVHKIIYLAREEAQELYPPLMRLKKKKDEKRNLGCDSSDPVPA